MPRRALFILLGACLIALILYILGVPGGIIALVGIGVWVATLIAQGGHLEGNPYKRMGYTGIPDFAEAWQYQKRREQERSDEPSTSVTVFMFIIGLIFLFVGMVGHFYPLNLWGLLP